MRHTKAGEFRLHWQEDPGDGRWFQMYGVHQESGQLFLISTFHQGPFDTALDVAQWAWKAIAREVPPASD